MKGTEIATDTCRETDGEKQKKEKKGLLSEAGILRKRECELRMEQ